MTVRSRKPSAKQLKAIQVRRPFAQFLEDQKATQFDKLSPELEALVDSFITWYNAKYPSRALYKWYQPQCIKLVANAQRGRFYFEIGCGGGKTTIFVIASLLRSHFERTPIVLIAPQLGLLNQTLVGTIMPMAAIVNSFLEETGREPLLVNLATVSSGSFKVELDGETYEAEKLSSGEDVAAHLDSAGAGDIILVCNKSLQILAAGVELTEAPIQVLIDEGHTLQTGEELNAKRMASIINTLSANATSLTFWSATPRISLQNNVILELVIDSPTWSLANGVYHADPEASRFSLPAAALRRWGILKPDYKFYHGLANALKPDEDLDARLKSLHHVKPELAYDEIRMIEELVKLMKPGKVALNFLASVPNIKLFMSADFSAYREGLEAKYDVKFYQSHGDIQVALRHADVRAIEEALDSGSMTKHVILNHSTWILGMDLKAISWVLINRDMASHNLIQASSRGSRWSSYSNECNIVFPDTLEGSAAREMVTVMLESIGSGEVKHYLCAVDSKVGDNDLDEVQDEPEASDATPIEITSVGGSAYIRKFGETILDLDAERRRNERAYRIATGEITDCFARNEA